MHVMFSIADKQSSNADSVIAGVTIGVILFVLIITASVIVVIVFKRLR